MRKSDNMKSGSKQTGFRQTLFSVSVSSLFGVGLSFILLIPIAAALLSGFLSDASASILRLAAVFLSACIAGVFATRNRSGRYIPIGLFTGAVIFVLLLILGILLYENLTFTKSAVGVLCAALLGSTLGGLLSGSAFQKNRK